MLCAWVNAVVSDVRHLFDALQLSSSHLAIMIDESNLTLLAGGGESLEQRHPVGASIVEDCTVPSFIV